MDKEGWLGWDILQNLMKYWANCRIAVLPHCENESIPETNNEELNKADKE